MPATSQTPRVSAKHARLGALNVQLVLVTARVARQATISTPLLPLLPASNVLYYVLLVRAPLIVRAVLVAITSLLKGHAKLALPTAAAATATVNA